MQPAPTKNAVCPPMGRPEKSTPRFRFWRKWISPMESMSNTPYMIPNIRWGLRLGDAEILDGQYKDGFLCPLAEEMMGRTAERLAEKYDISRDEQDRFALRSHQRAAAAWAEGRMSSEVVPVPVPPAYRVAAERDNGIRENQTLEALARLRPAFARSHGTVTAGNGHIT